MYRESAEGAGRRVDSGVSEGDEVSPGFETRMLGQADRGEDQGEQKARLRLLAMLDEFAIGGLKTNPSFGAELLTLRLRRAAMSWTMGFIPRHEAYYCQRRNLA